MKDKTNIFLVEDDPNFGAVLKSYLEINDFNVAWVQDGGLALGEFKKGSFDICILDVMLPTLDGFELARKIRAISGNIPLIFLTAKRMKEDMITGFRIGADDYLVKPFDSEVLIMKIKAILRRRSGSDEEDSTHEFTVGRYLFNYPMRTITFQDETHKLSPKEAELLNLLCRHMNHVMPRELALQSIWEEDSYFTTRSMDVYISKLRKYLSGDPSIQITNIHGSGYRLSVE